MRGRGRGGGRGRGRGRRPAVVPDEPLGRAHGARASAGVASPATRPLVPTPAGAHRWLGRRLRICKVSEHGARRYINAVIVFHDPSESHPFHVMHDDGTQTWLAVLDDTRVVHMIDPKTKRRVARHFTWLTPERVVAASTPARASLGAFLDALTPNGVGVGVGALATPAAPTIAAPGLNATTADANPTQHHQQQHPHQHHHHPPPRRAAYEKRLDPRMGAAPSHDWEERQHHQQRSQHQHPHRHPYHDPAGGSQLDGILEEFGASPPGPLVGASGAGRGRGRNTPANANGARARVGTPLGTAEASGGKRRRVSDAVDDLDDDLDAMARAVGAAAAAAAAVLGVDERADVDGSASASERGADEREPHREPEPGEGQGEGEGEGGDPSANPNPTPTTRPRPGSAPFDVDGGITPGALAAARHDASRALRSAAVTLRAAAILESRRPPKATHPDASGSGFGGDDDDDDVDGVVRPGPEAGARVRVRVRSSARRCDACAATLVDAWRACARCGAATCAECCEERRAAAITRLRASGEGEADGDGDGDGDVKSVDVKPEGTETDGAGSDPRARFALACASRECAGTTLARAAEAGIEPGLDFSPGDGLIRAGEPLARLRDAARAAGATLATLEPRFDDGAGCSRLDRDESARASLLARAAAGSSALESAAAAAADATVDPRRARAEDPDPDLDPSPDAASTSWAAVVSSRDDALAATLDAARRGRPTTTTDAPLRERATWNRALRHLVDPRSLETRRFIIGASGEAGPGPGSGAGAGIVAGVGAGGGAFAFAGFSDGLFASLAADAALASPCPAVTDARGALNVLRRDPDDPAEVPPLAATTTESAAAAATRPILEACPLGSRAASLGVRATDTLVVVGAVEGEDRDPDRDRDEDEDEDASDANPGGPSPAARRWCVFRREDAGLLSRWLALHPPGAPAHPAFERRRRARVVADSAARLAAAFADDPHADPAEDAAAAADAAAADADADDAEVAAYDALRDVHPDRAAAELHRRHRALGPEELRALANDLGIVPREATQRRGDAVFVPAGCPAQATSVATHVAVVAACLSHASLPAALRATRVARRCRGVPGGAEGGAEWGGFCADARAVVARAAARIEGRGTGTRDAERRGDDDGDDRGGPAETENGDATGGIVQGGGS